MTQVADELFNKLRGLLLLDEAQPLLGGVNNRFGPQYVPEGSCFEMYDADLRDPTRPKSRDGYSIIGSAQSGIAAGLLAKRINSLSALSPSGTGSTRMFVTIPDAGSGETYRTATTTTAWERVLDTATGLVGYDPGAAEDIPTAQLNDCLYVLGSTPIAIGTSGTYTASSNTDDTAVPAFGSPPHNGVDLCYAFNRGWILTADLKVAYSKFLPAETTINTDWARLGLATPTSSAGRLAVSPNSSNVARGIVPWNEASLIILYDNSIEEIVVPSALATSGSGISDPFSNASRHVIERRFGLIARRAKASLGQQLYFMDQYGSVRMLSQTVNGTQAGVTALPLSESIASELPGRLTMSASRKVFFEVFREYLLVFYPRDGATQCNAVAVYNLAYGFWEGVWRTARAQGHALVSDIRGDGNNGFELFTSDGESTSPLSKVHRWFDGSYADNGAAITYEEYTRGYDAGLKGSDKLLMDFELEGVADSGVQASVAAQVDENGRTWTLQPKWTGAAVPGDWPLTTASFPLTAASFPLTDPAYQLVRKAFSFEQLDEEAGRRGRWARFAITCTPGVGKRWTRAGYRFTYKLEELAWMKED